MSVCFLSYPPPAVSTRPETKSVSMRHTHSLTHTLTLLASLFLLQRLDLVEQSHPTHDHDFESVQVNVAAR